MLTYRVEPVIPGDDTILDIVDDNGVRIPAYPEHFSPGQRLLEDELIICEQPCLTDQGQEFQRVAFRQSRFDQYRADLKRHQVSYVIMCSVCIVCAVICFISAARGTITDGQVLLHVIIAGIAVIEHFTLNGKLFIDRRITS